MLAARVLTASILGLSVITAILYLPPEVTQACLALFIFVGALEWAALAGARSFAVRGLYAGATIVVTLGVHELIRARSAEYGLLVVACTWWFIAALWIVCYQLRERPRVQSPAVIALMGWVVFIPAWTAVSTLLLTWPVLLIALFAVVWSADILAFFGGRSLGRRRLASRVSPGKTWEGVVIGLGGTLALAAIAAPLLQPVSFAAVLMIVAASVIASVVGDLLESLLKRTSGKKDSGSILPGHGGILDRVDSVLAAAPVFTLGFMSTGQQ